MSNYLNVVGIYATAIFLGAIGSRLVTRWYARRSHPAPPSKGSQISR
jgi:hypothetical protein